VRALPPPSAFAMTNASPVYPTSCCGRVSFALGCVVLLPLRVLLVVFLVATGYVFALVATACAAPGALRPWRRALVRATLHPLMRVLLWGLGVRVRISGAWPQPARHSASCRLNFRSAVTSPALMPSFFSSW
jgi:hypothetical protein